jgi:putative tryptophan/tyrosine transport system substrate-binding protein
VRRREFITLLGGAAAAWPLAAGAQQPDQIRMIGVLIGFVENDPTGIAELTAFRDALTRVGWKEGSNLRIEVRWGGADPDRNNVLAKELVNLRPDAILGLTTLATRALARETKTIPIVFAIATDPIGNGFAANLAHPGGNITGFTSLDPAMGR